jgi:hypothetical protein
MRAWTLMEKPDLKNGGGERLQRDATPARPISPREHEATEFLGSGGSIVFRCCPECGDVLFSQAGRRVAVPGA